MPYQKGAPDNATPNANYLKEKNMPKLITGGIAFIGTYLVHALLQKGEKVVLFNVVTKSPLIHDIKDKIKL